MRVRSVWQTPDTTVEMVLERGAILPELTILYWSREHREAYREKREQQDEADMVPGKD